MDKMLRRNEVCAVTGLCYTTIFNMEKVGKFPSRRRISASRVGWLNSEVQRWLTGSVAVLVAVFMIIGSIDTTPELFEDSDELSIEALAPI